MKTATLLLCLIPALGWPCPIAATGGDFVLGSPRTPTEVAVGLTLNDVTAVDERAETFEVEATLTLRWHDPRQAFDPAGVGAPRKIFQGDYQFQEIFAGWWPQLVITNGHGNRTREAVLLEILPDGRMRYVEEFNAVVEMPSDLRAFPFDEQRFAAFFHPLGMSDREIVLTVDGTVPKRADGRRDVAQWHLLGVDTRVRSAPLASDGGGARSSQLAMELHMARRPGYILGTIVLPLTVLLMLTWSIFWMDEEGLGSRMDISFIGILTVVAYQFVIADDLPKIAYWTVFDGFLLTAYLCMAGCVVVNLVVDKLNRAGRRETGDRLDLACRWAFPLAFVGANGLLYALMSS